MTYGEGIDVEGLDDQAQPPDRPPAPPMEQRTVVLLVAGFFAVLLAAVTMLLPVPYVVYRPGPVLNTLGSAAGKKLIAVTGHATYPATGRLDLTTVSVSGGPGHPVTLFGVIGSWLDRSTAVMPYAQVFPDDATEKQTDAQNKQEMVSSQESATAAALGTLGIPVPTDLAVAGVDPKVPAHTVLKFGDVITAVDGRPVADLKALSARLQRGGVGHAVSLTVKRGATTMTFGTRTVAGDGGRAVLGIFIDPHFTFPFSVKIQIEDIGGPSAGTMFALGIIDTLTPGDLTGGAKIAGTGTMAADGSVGPIGGIRQKLVGARDASNAWFLAPEANCNEVRDHVPDGLTVAKIATLDQAEDAVKAIAAGHGTTLPGC